MRFFTAKGNDGFRVNITDEFFTYFCIAFSISFSVFFSPIGSTLNINLKLKSLLNDTILLFQDNNVFLNILGLNTHVIPISIFILALYGNFTSI